MKHWTVYATQAEYLRLMQEGLLATLSIGALTQGIAKGDTAIILDDQEALATRARARRVALWDDGTTCVIWEKEPIK